MSLAELQRLIQGNVLRGDASAARVVRGTERFDAQSRLRVYADAFQERLVGALTVTFPALRRVLGEEPFRDLTRAFVAQHPPHHFSIRYFGAGLDAFIATTLSGIKGRTLSDLARWEWTLAAAFDAADTKPIDATALATLDPTRWGELRFQLAPSLQRLNMASNAVQWWRFATQEASRPTRWRRCKPAEWVVWRTDFSTFFRSLPADEAMALDRVASDHSFASICEGISETHTDNAATRAATLLSQWLRAGWIVSLS